MNKKIFQYHQESCEKGFVYYPSPTLEKMSELVLNVRQPGGVIGGKLSNLCSYLIVRGLYGWFREADYANAKRDFFCAAKAAILSNKAYVEPTYSFDNVLFFLLSDSEEIITWLAQDVGSLYGESSSKKWRNLVNEPHYHKFNLFLALQKKWELLAVRSAFALAEGGSKKLSVVHTLYPFYLALANGDTSGMREAILEIISPKRLHKQNQSVSPQSRFYLSAWGTIFAKIAMRNGYDLEINSPWIPRECLPIQPLIGYETPYDFLNVDIFTEYEGWAKPFSPKRPGEAWFDLELGSDPTKEK